MFPGPTRGVAAAVLGFALVVLGAPGPATAARWDTYNNANRLNSITATGGVVWCASDLGVHRYDPTTGVFTRFAKNGGELASNAVTEVEVDPQGNTWFATRGRGVSVLRANGTWRTLDAFDGLPADTVNCLEPTPDGMWVGTDEGVAFFRDFSLEGAWPDGVNPSPFASNDIKDVLQVGDSVWVATPGGAYVTKADEGVVWSRRIDGLVGVSVRALAAVGDEVWCVAGNRVHRGGQTGLWTLAEEGLPATSSFHVRSDADRLLLGTNAGIFTRTATTDWTLLGNGLPPAAWVDFDDDGESWAGNAEGLWRFNGTEWRISRSPGPVGNWVYGLALDGSNVWIGTQDAGASRFDGTSWQTFIPPPGASIDTTLQSRDFLIAMFVDSRGDIWIGDWGSSIARIDDSGPTLQVTHFFGPEEGLFDAFNTYGWATAEDRAGNVWIGLDTATRGIPPPPKGLHRIAQDGTRATFNPQDGVSAMSASQVRAIAFGPGPGFEMWVGYAGGGVDIFTDPTLETRSGRITEFDALNQRLLDDDIWAIEMNGDSVWIASSAGLNRYSRATRTRREAIGTQPPTSQGAVHPLAIDAAGGVWWGTTSGVYHRRPDRSVEVFNSANSPLLSDIITSIDIDRSNGDVWISTTSGVNRYDADAASGGGGSTAGPAKFDSYPNPAFTSAAGVRIFGAGIEGAFEGKVHDIRGRVVRTLRGNASLGGIWDAKDENGRRMPPGVYFLSVTQSGVTRTGRVLLVR